MITLFKSNTIYPLTELKEALACQIRQLPDKIESVGTPNEILRYEFPCEEIDELAWLHNQTTKNKIYWSNRNKGFMTAGIGIADLKQGSNAIDRHNLFTYMQDHLSVDNPSLRYYGGFCFEDTVKASEWAPYKSFRFIVPRFEFCKTADETVFAINIALKDMSEKTVNAIIASLEQINFSPTTRYRSVPVVQSREDYPQKQGWREMFQKISANGKSNQEKIVLARKSNFIFDKDIDPMALIKHLKDITPHCYHFCFQTDPYQGFLGASPEKLYKRTEGKIESEALAGTKPRGATQEDDTRLADELLHSTKEANEHKYVIDAITEALKPLCQNLTCDASSRLLKLKEGQHLITQCQGTLRETVTDAQILDSLHPTPAVAGCPKDQALDIIKDIEPFERGWYCAPVGYVGFNQAEFAVAIRCGLVEKNTLSLFAGAGIVDGSTWEEEWNEVEHKISSFIKVFDL